MILSPLMPVIYSDLTCSVFESKTMPADSWFSESLTISCVVAFATSKEISIEEDGENLN